MPGQHYVNTWIQAPISPGTDIVITPDSMLYIGVGRPLIIDGQNPPGSGTGEQITVKTITSTNFTADVVHPHAGPSYCTNDPLHNAVMWGT